MRPRLRPGTDSNKGAQDIDRPVEDYTWGQVRAYLFGRQSLLAVVVLLFIATRLWLLLAFEAQLTDTAHYARHARQGVDLGQVAYRDFVVEYPPVAWWLIAMPRLVDSETYLDPTPAQETFRQFFHWYVWWFHAELLLADMVCLGLMFAIGRRISPTAELVLPAAYTLLTIAQPHLVYDRLDLVLLMFFLLCIGCWLRSLEPSPAANRWATASYLFLGLGISFKIMPVIFVPFLLLADVWAAGGAGRFAGRAGALAVGALGPFLVYIPSAGWGVLKLFQYHSERGTNLESIWSSIMLVAAKFGVPCSVYASHGGFNLGGDWSSALKIVSGIAMLTTAASFGLWALLWGRRYDRRLALDTAILVLVNSTVLSHVYSPQYLNWLMPLALLLAMNIFPRNWAVWCLLVVLVAAIVGISSWLVLPDHSVEFVTLQTLPVVLCVTRSGCLVGLALLLNFPFFAKYGLVPWRTAREAPDALAAAT